MFLRELYEDQARSIVAVMPGGFHPFHPGHKSLYDWAVKTFGQPNVYVAATNDTATRPFPFEVKKKLAAMAGVPESNFIQVKSPFNAASYKELLDDKTALVFVRSQKDKTEHPKPDQVKKNGEPGYLRTYTGKDLKTADEAGYMAYGPTINFDFSGMSIKSASELRAAWPNMSDEEKLQATKLMYGDGAKAAVQLLDKALGNTEKVGEAAYEGNVGIMELMKFFAKAKDKDPGLVSKVKNLIKQKKDNEVWKIVQDYTGTELQGQEFNESILETLVNEAKKTKITEAEYQGEKVTLDKPIRVSGEDHAFKVYVKNDKGNVVKVTFGDPDMPIQRDSKESRENFKSRHNCSSKKDKTTAGYWSCKAWDPGTDWV